MTFQKKVGDWGENLVAEEYKSRGYRIIGRNVKIQSYKQLGEIDIIARKKDELIFVEVKTRGSDDFMDPLEAVSWRKVQKLRKAVIAYAASKVDYEKMNYRIDVAIVKKQLDGKDESVIIIEDAIQDLS